MLSIPATVYRPRNPQSSDYHRCVEDHLETIVRLYEERFERRYGFWRPYLKKVIDRYLECGDLHHGFARVKCRDCHHEYLLAFYPSIAEKPINVNFKLLTLLIPSHSIHSYMEPFLWNILNKHRSSFQKDKKNRYLVISEFGKFLAGQLQKSFIF